MHTEARIRYWKRRINKQARAADKIDLFINPNLIFHVHYVMYRNFIREKAQFANTSITISTI